MDFHPSALRCNGVENGVPLSADGQTIRGVFHIASRVNTPATRDQGGTDLEIRIGGVGVMRRLFC